MNRQRFRRWLLLDGTEWTWMGRRPLWQYLVLDWARAVIAGLIGFAIAAALLRHLPPPGSLIGFIGATILGRPFFARRHWQRIQAQVPPASDGTRN
jgi:hypothetical protein